MIVLTSVDTYS